MQSSFLYLETKAEKFLRFQVLMVALQFIIRIISSLLRMFVYPPMCSIGISIFPVFSKVIIKLNILRQLLDSNCQSFGRNNKCYKNGNRAITRNSEAIMHCILCKFHKYTFYLHHIYSILLFSSYPRPSPKHFPPRFMFLFFF